MALGVTIVLGLIVGVIGLVGLGIFIYALVEGIREREYQKGTVGSAIAGLFGTCSLVLILLSHLDYRRDYAASYHTLVNEIVSLDRDSVVEGRFTIGCGTVETKPVYYYYYKVKENTYTLGSLKSENQAIYIVETDSYVPSIYKVKESNVEPNKYYYNIYVPFGTVVVNYSI